jgi:dTDP-4-amino-4,6-dideoxygalactose transaminase
MTIDPDGDWYYQQVSLGFNYRMTELQAALGISQMQRLDEFIAKRHILQENYDSLLSALPIIKPYQDKDSYSALHLYPIQIELDKVSNNREQIFNVLTESGVGVNVHYIPIHTQPYYLQFGFSEGDFPNSEAYYSGAISIPLFHTMTAEQQDTVIDALKQVLQ